MRLNMATLGKKHGFRRDEVITPSSLLAFHSWRVLINGYLNSVALYCLQYSLSHHNDSPIYFQASSSLDTAVISSSKIKIPLSQPHLTPCQRPMLARTLFRLRRAQLKRPRSLTLKSLIGMDQRTLRILITGQAVSGGRTLSLLQLSA